MTIINLTTPMSDDKERQRRNRAVLDAIEQYTEERMDDAYGRIHTDGSRSGGQPLIANRKAHTMIIEVLAAWGIEPSNTTPEQLTIATTEALCRAIKQIEDLRQPTHHNVAVAAAPADRIGGAGVVTHGVVGVATQSDADLLEEMRFTYETFCSEGYNDPDYTEALDYEIEARGWEAAFAVAVAKLRQPTQSDALHDQLLQECLVKLRDVQGTEAPKQYACNLIKRIERVLQGQSK